MKFSELSIDQRIVKSLADMGFNEMTDIQSKSLTVALQGNDIIAQAMTGSGKTAVFGITIAQRVEQKKGIQALVITPTRELANQVTEESMKFSKYCFLNVVAVYGGVSIENQIRGE